MSTLATNACYCGDEAYALSVMPELAAEVKDIWCQDVLTCDKCKVNFHLKCLRVTTPSSLQGDYLFIFTCQRCSTQGEVYTRPDKISWVHIVMLLLYDLQSSSDGNHGYFHYKMHIHALFMQQQRQLFPKQKLLTKRSAGNVSSCLSMHNGVLFQSGTSVLGELGWWKLIRNQPPLLHKAYKQYKTAERLAAKPAEEVVSSGSRSMRKKKKLSDDFVSNTRKRTKAKEIVIEHRTISHEPQPSLPEKPTSPPATEVEIESSQPSKEVLIGHGSTDTTKLSSFENDTNRQSPNNSIPPAAVKPLSMGEEDDLAMSTRSDDILTEMKVTFERDNLQFDMDIDVDPSLDSTAVLDTTKETLEPSTEELLEGLPTLSADDCSQISFQSDIQASTNAMEEENRSETADPSEQKETLDEQENKSKALSERNTDHTKTDAAQSGTSQTSTPTTKGDKSQCAHKPKKVRRWTVYEEEKLRTSLDERQEISKSLAPRLEMLRQIIHLRKIKRARGLPLLDIERSVAFDLQEASMEPENDILSAPIVGGGQNLILNRFTVNAAESKVDLNFVPFLNKLHGVSQSVRNVKSPYTSRILKAFIWRDYETKPPKLKILKNIRERCSIIQEQDSIDYKYVSTEHIPVINRICHRAFWPGIDLSECLQYPDFSCVTMYKKLIIGFAFMVPDVKHNEAYISFLYTHPDWRGAGIASVMLYHLIQTCMGKDITLHVSVNNPALSLYLKFGFRVTEIIHNFYEKFHPADSNLSSHALHMKLDRY